MPNSEPSNLFRGKYRISSTRLQDWDYSSAGLYFVTICVKDRQPCLAKIANGETRLRFIFEATTPLRFQVENFAQGKICAVR